MTVKKENKTWKCTKTSFGKYTLQVDSTKEKARSLEIFPSRHRMWKKAKKLNLKQLSSDQLQKLLRTDTWATLSTEVWTKTTLIQNFHKRITIRERCIMQVLSRMSKIKNSRLLKRRFKLSKASKVLRICCVRITF